MLHSVRTLAILFLLTAKGWLSLVSPVSAQLAPSTVISAQKRSLVRQAPGRVTALPRENDAIEGEDDDAQAQSTSVAQLSDIQPTDWAFQALQSLVERYDCVAGYPNQTFRGNRSLSRYEFAAGLNACLTRINELLATNTGNLVRKDDLMTLQKLQESFAAALVVSRGRVDALEARTATLEKQQFSTTTLLTGNVLFQATVVGGGNRADGSGTAISRNPILSDFAWLYFTTSFKGDDVLTARFEASNTPELTVATGTNMGRLILDGDSGNQVSFSALSYQFKLNPKLTVHLSAQDELHEVLGEGVEAVSPLSDHVSGSISRFGQFNPLFHLGGESVAGAGLSYEFNQVASLGVAYVGGGNTSDPLFGLFGGTYVAVAQLTLRPVEPWALGFTYAHSYSSNNDDPNNALNTGTGSDNANDPFNGSPTSANSYGFETAYQISPKFIVAASAGFTDAHAEGGANRGANANIVNWAVTLALPDLGGNGNLGGFVIGMPPKVTHNDIADRADPNTSLQLELFYRYAVNDFIAVTPGLIVVTHPEQNSTNDTIYIGTVRTTFSF